MLLCLFDRTTHGLAATLLSEALLQAALFTGLEVEAILLDVLADAFALDLAAETSHGLFEGLVFTNVDEDQLDLQMLDEVCLCGNHDCDFAERPAN